MEEQIRTAIDIDTELFFRIVRFLKESGWRLIAEYDPEIFDKAAYFDYYEFQKGFENIQMGWDIWDEGEIKATNGLLKMLELKFQCGFKLGEGINIETARKKGALLVEY